MSCTISHLDTNEQEVSNLQIQLHIVYKIEILSQILILLANCEMSLFLENSRIFDILSIDLIK